MSDTALRAAVVGAGPSGFYATDQLLKAGFEVDLLEILPTPFGLVRAGVAPDHPKIKSVTRVYEKTANHPGFRFYGGVELGAHISRQDLLDRYHVVLYAVGTASDNRLNIPGEERPGSHGALEFVAWYNGHPDYADQEFDLSATRAVVIGNGNVAVDVARMLVLDPDEVAATDTADHAVGPLSERPGARGDRARPPRPRAGRVHDARAARAGRADPRRHHRRPGRDGARPVQRALARGGGRADQQAQRRSAARVRAARAARPRAPRRAALPELAGRDPRRRRGRPGHRDPRRQEPDRQRPRGRHRRGGDDRLRPRDPLDRLPRLAAGRDPVRRAQGPDLQPRRPRAQPRRRARGRRVRRRLGQARPVRRDRHQQEGRDRHRRPHPRGPRSRQAQHALRRRPGAPARSSSPSSARSSSHGRAGARSTRTRPASASLRAARA